ncbi:unnamed protein product [Mytilus edulis]|uniref:TNFR-Cys domain-containing protein n=1 Tax=Mytilus edulis TaxID=6550 RepID=A0A8S3PVF0_MYTED|nr:unnamed protein product [Mytilus edulis]
MKRCGIKKICIFLIVLIVLSDSETTKPNFKLTSQSNIYLMNRTTCCSYCYKVYSTECNPTYNGECFVKCPYWDHRQSCSGRCTGSQIRLLESEDDCKCVFQDAPSHTVYETVGVLIYVIVVSLITLMIWLIMFGCKVTARLCAKKTRPICVVNDRRTTVRPETLRMNFKLTTEGKQARQQNIANQRVNYCDPWEVTSSV